MQKIKQIFVIAVLALSAVGNVMAIEEAKYNSILKEGAIEVRDYESQIIAETLVSGDFEDAGGEAFKRLFKYISGENTARQKIDMTAPVGLANASQEIDMTSPVGQTRIDGKWAVNFLMPASYSMETIPQPKDPKIRLRLLPDRHIAAIEYSGFWSEESYLENKGKLESWISEKQYNVIGQPIWARYNPPFTPWFLRRNEILIPINMPELVSQK